MRLAFTRLFDSGDVPIDAINSLLGRRNAYDFKIWRPGELLLTNAQVDRYYPHDLFLVRLVVETFDRPKCFELVWRQAYPLASFDPLALNSFDMARID